MAIRQQLEARAKERRIAGDTFEQIADALGTNEKTIRRWAVTWSETPSDAPLHGWPEEHKWPGWTIQDLEGLGLADFNRDAWESNLAMIRTAETQGNHYVGWFFKNLVELARREKMPDGSLPWALGIAALPVLEEWLGCPPCDELTGLIEQHQPWEGGNPLARQKRRAAYQRAARTPATAVRQCIIEAQARLFILDQGQQRVSPGPVYLAALAERVPMFDRAPRGSPYRQYNLGGILLGILATPKGD